MLLQVLHSHCFKKARLLWSTDRVSGPGASSIVGGPPREIVWPLHGVPGGLGSGKEPISRGRKVELGQSSHRGWEGGSRLLPPVGSGRLPPVGSRGRASWWRWPSSQREQQMLLFEGSDSFCGLDRPSHTSPLPLPFPTKAAPPYGSSSPPYLRLESRLHPGRGPKQLACQITRPRIRPQSALRGKQSLLCGQRSSCPLS